MMALPSLPWELTSIAVALITLFIVVLLDMFGRGFGMQSVNMWVKSEYLQVGVSFLIIALVFVMLAAGNRVASDVSAAVSAASGNIELNQAAVNNLGNPTKIGKEYLLSIVSCTSILYQVAYIWGATYADPGSKISLGPKGNEDVTGGIVLGALSSFLHYVTQSIVYLALFSFIQYHMLTVAQYTMLPLFLPIGLVLRAFPLTRGAGGFITAFAIGFAFVFPITYVLVLAMMPNAHVLCGQVTIQANNLQPGDPCTNSSGAQMAAYYQLKKSTVAINTFLSLSTDLIGILFLQGLFYPTACLIVTFTFIRQTGNLFGADLAEIGRGLIKII